MKRCLCHRLEPRATPWLWGYSDRSLPRAWERAGYFASFRLQTASGRVQIAVGDCRERRLRAGPVLRNGEPAGRMSAVPLPATLRARDRPRAAAYLEGQGLSGAGGWVLRRKRVKGSCSPR